MSLGLQQVADAFIFQIWTGLDYGDYKTFDPSLDIITDETGRKWITKKRFKGGLEALLPLMPIAEHILNKYTFLNVLGQPYTQLPPLCNQTFNKYLKQIGGILGFTQHLTTYVGRKTFGMLMLNSGFSLEAVSKMLAHASISTTQRHYAKIIKKRLDLEVSELWEKVFARVA